MTIMKQHFAYCDIEDCPFNSIEAGTESFPTLYELRDAMKRDGWKRIQGKDICPDCVKAKRHRTS